MRKIGLAKLQSTNQTGKIRQLQAICYLLGIIILELLVFIFAIFI